MAYAPPDPLKVRARRAATERAIEDAAIARMAAEQEKHEIRRQVRDCYHEHSPKQIAQAGRMMQAGRIAGTIEANVAAGIVCWERVGRSNGGGRKRNLYRCCAVIV